MRLFLDSRVLLAACGSDHGASRELFRLAPSNRWDLLASSYVAAEVLGNLPHLSATATDVWASLRSQLTIVGEVLTVDRPVVFEAAKDRPILFTALAWADVLLTLDRGDFGQLLGGDFYGLPILTPGAFLQRWRASAT